MKLAGTRPRLEELVSDTSGANDDLNVNGNPSTRVKSTRARDPVDMICVVEQACRVDFASACPFKQVCSCGDESIEGLRLSGMICLCSILFRIDGCARFVGQTLPNRDSEAGLAD